MFINGYEITADSQNLHYTHAYKSNKIQPQSVGIEQVSPGAFAPTLDYTGYAKRGIGLQTAHNILYLSGAGITTDTEFIITELLGNNAAPGQGDIAVLFDGTRLKYNRNDPIQAVQTLDASFKPRGKRQPPFPTLQYDNAAFKTATNISSAPYDDGAETSAGTSLGAVAQLQVYSPTAVAATGNINLSGQPNDADTFTITIGSTVYTYTFKTALTPTAGQVLIGASTAASILNLWYAIVGAPEQSGIGYAAGTIPIPQYLLTSPLYAKVPNASNQIILTAANAQLGTTGNAIALAATVNASTHLAVSGATLAGGVAGDTYNVTVASSTTSGGSYTTFATFSGVGAINTAVRTEIALGVVINEWIKVTATLATGAGTAQTMGFNVVFGRWFLL